MSNHRFVELITSATEGLPNARRIEALRSVVAQTADTEIATHFTRVADELVRVEQNCRQLHLHFCSRGKDSR